MPHSPTQGLKNKLHTSRMSLFLWHVADFSLMQTHLDFTAFLRRSCLLWNVQKIQGRDQDKKKKGCRNVTPFIDYYVAILNDASFTDC